jgi:hypothetical protein
VLTLYFSLRCGNFITAYSASILVGLIAPWAASILLLWGRTYADLSEAIASVPALIYQILFQVTLGAIFWVVLWRRLERRAFPLERTGGS